MGRNVSNLAFPPVGKLAFAIETSPTHTFVQRRVPDEVTRIRFDFMHLHLTTNGLFSDLLAAVRGADLAARSRSAAIAVSP